MTKVTKPILLDETGKAINETLALIQQSIVKSHEVDWGEIKGLLADQTDLMAEFAKKEGKHVLLKHCDGESDQTILADIFTTINEYSGGDSRWVYDGGEDRVYPTLFVVGGSESVKFAYLETHSVDGGYITEVVVAQIVYIDELYQYEERRVELLAKDIAESKFVDFSTEQTIQAVKTFKGGLNLGNTRIQNMQEPSGPTDAATKNYVDGVGNRVSSIEGKIPAQASADNQLADKAFVNSSVATNTANFKGTFEVGKRATIDAVPEVIGVRYQPSWLGNYNPNMYLEYVGEEVEFGYWKELRLIVESGEGEPQTETIRLYEEGDYETFGLLDGFLFGYGTPINVGRGTVGIYVHQDSWDGSVYGLGFSEDRTGYFKVTVNDYIFVRSVYGVFYRHKWTENRQFEFEFSIEGVNFTSEQWNTINSGLTGNDVTSLRSALTLINNVVPLDATLSNPLVTQGYVEARHIILPLLTLEATQSELKKVYDDILDAPQGSAFFVSLPEGRGIMPLATAIGGSSVFAQYADGRYSHELKITERVVPDLGIRYILEKVDKTFATTDDLSGKQNKLIAGTGITIADDGKTISSSVVYHIFSEDDDTPEDLVQAQSEGKIIAVQMYGALYKATVVDNNGRYLTFVSADDQNVPYACRYQHFNGEWLYEENELSTLADADRSYQHKLTAGTGITIENNVISATGEGEMVCLELGSSKPDNFNVIYNKLQSAFSTENRKFLSIKVFDINSSTYLEGTVLSTTPHQIIISCLSPRSYVGSKDIYCIDYKFGDDGTYSRTATKMGN